MPRDDPSRGGVALLQDSNSRCDLFAGSELGFEEKVVDGAFAERHVRAHSSVGSCPNRAIEGEYIGSGCGEYDIQ